MTTKTKEVSTESATAVATRKVTIWSTQERSTQTIETSAKTWGELKGELSNAGNSRAVIRETRNTLESGGAQLPNTDFTLFLYPEKVRSGRTVKVHKVAKADWSHISDSELDAKLESYNEEFKELMDSFIPGDCKEAIKLSDADQELEKEALALASELNF